MITPKTHLIGTALKDKTVTNSYPEDGFPPPHSPVLNPTPAEFDVMEEQQRVKKMSDKECHRKAELDKKAEEEKKEKGSTGAFFKVGKMFSNVTAKIEQNVSDISSTAQIKAREAAKKKNIEKFTLEFPGLVGEGETLVAMYQCSTIHRNKVVFGNVAISTNYLCFFNDSIRDQIALKDVTSLQKAITLPITETEDGEEEGEKHKKKEKEGQAVFIIKIPDKRVIYNAVQVFTRSKTIYHFFNVSSTNMYSMDNDYPIDAFYNFLDHRWRIAVIVPMRDVKYVCV